MNDRLKKQSILIAEDTPANVDILLDALSDKYDTSVALDGETALRCVGDVKPDLILLDVVMPGMDGYEVCRRLKASEETRDIPVIFLTSLTMADDEARGLRMGAVDYIAKPFSPKIVEARVHSHMELNRYRRHLERMVADRTSDLTITREATIQSMAILAKFRDPETGGHIQRTRSYVESLVRYLHDFTQFAEVLDPESIELISQSAPLHDIGKVGVPDRILLKPGRLTPEEWAEMKKHPLYGSEVIKRTERLLGPNSFLRFAREITECHHERWDGTGYPNGLSGNDIPISARAMAIADVYDALTSERPYKEAMTHQEAFREIIDGSGTHFDPEMVSAFRTLQYEFESIAKKYRD